MEAHGPSVHNGYDTKTIVIFPSSAKNSERLLCTHVIARLDMKISQLSKDTFANEDILSEEYINNNIVANF